MNWLILLTAVILILWIITIVNMITKANSKQNIQDKTEFKCDKER
jgi:hypothetical protein